jgi:hypothetical protein
MSGLSGIGQEIRSAFHVGTPDPRGFLGFAVRYLFLCVPAVVFGHLIDQLVEHAQVQEWLGKRPGVYLVAQTIVWLVFFYVVIRWFPHYAWEFQSTYAGMAFGTLFFTVQDNYVVNLQEALTFTNKYITINRKGGVAG